jgi:pyridoxal 5'-phosphate synthase pdxS subunit
VKAVTFYQDPSILVEVSKNLGEAMVGRNVSQMPEIEKLAGRGW